MTARKLRPFRKKASEMPNSSTVRPATAGPAMRAMLNIAEFRATALPTSSRPTISITKACRVGMSMAFVTPRRKARRKTIGTVTR